MSKYLLDILVQSEGGQKKNGKKYPSISWNVHSAELEDIERNPDAINFSKTSMFVILKLLLSSKILFSNYKLRLFLFFIEKKFCFSNYKTESKIQNELLFHLSIFDQLNRMASININQK